MKTKIFTKARGLMMLILATIITTNVWANETDELTYSALGFSCVSQTNDVEYVDFEDVSGSESDAVYAGQIARFKNTACHDYIQIRSKNSNSGIITTTSGGKAVSVSVSWNSATGASGTLNVYGSNSAYSAASDLYADATDGDLIGTIVYGTSTSLDIDDDYEFIGLRSNSGALYFDDISIEWSTKSLSSIALKTSATKTAYVAGEDFAAAGMVITATYSDASTEDIDYDTNSAKFSFSPSTNLSAGTTSVTVTYGGQTCTQTIAVYSVIISMVGEDESTTLTGEGLPSAPTRSGASINADNTTLYGFKKWVISNASLGSAATTKGNTITNPTGAVTLKAVYNAPRTVTWLVDGNAWTPYTTKGTGEDGTAVVQHGKAWSTLTLPTDPTPSDGCGQKFIGWVASPISGSLDKDDDAAAISALDIMTSANKASKTGGGHNINSNITFYAVFADYAE